MAAGAHGPRPGTFVFGGRQRHASQTLEIVDGGAQARQCRLGIPAVAYRRLDQAHESAKAVDGVLEPVGEPGHVLAQAPDLAFVAELELQVLQPRVQRVALSEQPLLVVQGIARHPIGEPSHAGEEGTVEGQGREQLRRAETQLEDGEADDRPDGDRHDSGEREEHRGENDLEPQPCDEGRAHPAGEGDQGGPAADTDDGRPDLRGLSPAGPAVEEGRREVEGAAGDHHRKHGPAHPQLRLLEIDDDGATEDGQVAQEEDAVEGELRRICGGAGRSADAPRAFRGRLGVPIGLLAARPPLDQP